MTTTIPSLQNDKALWCIVPPGNKSDKRMEINISNPMTNTNSYARQIAHATEVIKIKNPYTPLLPSNSARTKKLS